MDTEKDIEKLRATFAACLGLPAKAIVDDLKYNSVPQWDSVAHMALIAEIEQAFDILLDTDDVVGMESFGKARAILAKYGVAA
jgi:acyl carrier protein